MPVPVPANDPFPAPKRRTIPERSGRHPDDSAFLPGPNRALRRNAPPPIPSRDFMIMSALAIGRFLASTESSHVLCDRLGTDSRHAGASFDSPISAGDETGHLFTVSGDIPFRVRKAARDRGPEAEVRRSARPMGTCGRGAGSSVFHGDKFSVSIPSPLNSSPRTTGGGRPSTLSRRRGTPFQLEDRRTGDIQKQECFLRRPPLPRECPLPAKVG